MILIAENFNSSIPRVAKAMAVQNPGIIEDLADQLSASPADYLDVNAGTFLEQEFGLMQFVIRHLRRKTDLPLVLDSHNPEVLAQAADWLKQEALFGQARQTQLPRLLLNSITLAPDRYEPVLQIALRHQAGLIALLMDETGMPEGIEGRLVMADRLVSRLRQAGLPDSSIFLDPMVRPVSTDDQAGLEACRTLNRLRAAYPDIHLVVGLSNISFGLPARRYLNRAFLLQAMASGLDSAILNPLDQELMALCQAGCVIGGQDEWCMNYLSRHRKPEA